MKHFLPALAVALVAAAFPAAADEARSERIQFPKGKTQTTVSGKITGEESIVYMLNAKDGQFLKVSMETDKESADFNIYIPGRGPGDEALFGSAAGGRSYTGQLYKTGDHSISVFLNRNAARKGAAATFKLHVSVTAKAPAAAPAPAPEEKPATGAVPKKVKDDCLAALRKQVGDKGMKIISSKRGETSFIVDVNVDGAEKPWRCYHDGTKCTGTEYQGEGWIASSQVTCKALSLQAASLPPLEQRPQQASCCHDQYHDDAPSR